MADNTASAQVIADPADRSGALDQARAFFRAHGFETTEPFAGSFSISGPERLFEATFGVRLRRESRGGTVHLQADSPTGPTHELPLHTLPGKWAKALRITFSPPPAFGPAGY
jgi:hypothetical protein